MTGRVGGGRVRVEVPASSANLGPGFDSIGLGLELRDVVTAEVVRDGLQIIVEGQGAGVVPDDETHLVWRSMCAAWERLGVQPPTGLKLHCCNGVPHSRGLGSSAAAIVAGVALAHALVDSDVDEAALASIADVAGDLEGHPDNSSASVYGGLTLSWRDGEHWRTVCPPVHPAIVPVLFVPDSTLSTRTARAVLPDAVPLSDAARTAGRAALLVRAVTDSPDLLLPATAEWLHQQARRPSYPASMDLVDRLRDDGHAAVVSGAGPAVLVLTTRDRAPAVTGPQRWQRLTPGIATTGVRVVSY